MTSERAPASRARRKRRDRLSVIVKSELQPQSLVGSFFHSFKGEDVLWQGCIVAEPSPGLYLVELFEWFTGSSSGQRLVGIEAMQGWHFYDDRAWMNNAFEDEERSREARARQRESKPVNEPASDEARA